jgi:hypothetical protein
VVSRLEESVMFLFLFSLTDDGCLWTAPVHTRIGTVDNASVWKWAAVGPIIHYPSHSSYTNVSQRRNGGDRGEPKNWGKACLSASSSTTSPTWTAVGAKPGLRPENPATNVVSLRTVVQGRCCTTSRACTVLSYVAFPCFDD